MLNITLCNKNALIYSTKNKFLMLSPTSGYFHVDLALSLGEAQIYDIEILKQHNRENETTFNIRP